MGIHRCKRITIRLALIGALGMALTSAATSAVGAAAPVVSQIPRAGHTDPDLTALRRIWERQADAWSHGDANAYAGTYATDADLTNIKGQHLHTRRIIAATIQHYFDNQLKNTRLLRMEEEVRFVSPTMAIILRKDCVLYAAETACRRDNHSINTSIAVKSYGQWMIMSFHNTLVRQQR
jgi:uncharacterized protein (TIGR02246 family)